MTKPRCDFKDARRQSAAHYYTLAIFFDNQEHHGKHYSWPGLAYVRRKLKERYGYAIKERMLKYIVSDLVKTGQIKRVPRRRRGRHGICCQSSLTYVLRRGIKILFKWRRKVTNHLTYKAEAAEKKLADAISKEVPFTNTQAHDLVTGLGLNFAMT